MKMGTHSEANGAPPAEQQKRELEVLAEEMRALVPVEEAVVDPVSDSYRQMNFVSLVEDDEDFDAPRIFPIKAGDVVMEELPFASVVNNEHAGTVCHHCWKRDTAEIPLKRCTSCHFARYCDGACAKKGWKIHKLECSRLGDYYKEFGFVPEGLIRLVNLVLLKVKNGTTTSPEENCYPPTKRTFTTLCSHTEEIDKELGLSGKFQQNMQEIKRYVGAETFAQLSAEMVAETYSRVMTNSISIPDRLGSPLGVGLYLGISQFDHSCLPNSLFFCRHQPPKLSVTATQSLRSSKDVRISYVNPMKPTMERRKELKEIFYFVCQCGRCQGVEQDGMSRSLQCKTGGCRGYVLLGKDWKPMGPCPICEEWMEQNDARVQSTTDLMGRISKFVDGCHDGSSVDNSYSNESARPYRSKKQRRIDRAGQEFLLLMLGAKLFGSACSFRELEICDMEVLFLSLSHDLAEDTPRKSSGLLLTLHEKASEELFALNFYRIRLDILLASCYRTEKLDPSTALALLDRLILAYEFYLGPSSMSLCEALMNATRCCMELKSWTRAVGFSLKALDIVKALYLPDDPFYGEISSVLLKCRDALTDGISDGADASAKVTESA